MNADQSSAPETQTNRTAAERTTMPEAPAAHPIARLVGLAAARPATVAALATLLVSLVALAFPRLDVGVAGLFHHGAAGFPAERDGMLVALRAAGMGVTRIVVVGLVLALLAKLFLPMLARALSARRLLYLATSLALGPGLLVNAFLKEWWGRPRPRQIVEFGGTMEFFPAWVPGGACASNCSFPSGEASSSMWLVAIALLVPGRWQRPAIVVAASWGLIVSANRMAFGGHFLSDVVIAWGLVLTVVFACHHLFVERIGPEGEARIDAALARFGDRLRDLMSSVVPKRS